MAKILSWTLSKVTKRQLINKEVNHNLKKPGVLLETPPPPHSVESFLLYLREYLEVLLFRLLIYFLYCILRGTNLYNGVLHMFEIRFSTYSQKI